MGLKTLAEGILLQSIEDLWDRDLREESIAFLKSRNFRLCAELAGMAITDQIRLLTMVSEMVERSRETIRGRKTGAARTRRKMHAAKEITAAVG